MTATIHDSGYKKLFANQTIFPTLGQYALHFQYLLLNEKAYSRQQLLAIRNIVSTLFLAEAHDDFTTLLTKHVPLNKIG